MCSASVGQFASNDRSLTLNRSCGTRRGVSLAELVIACALFALLTAIVARIVLPLGKGVARGSHQIEYQQLALLAMNRLAGELTSTPDSAVTLDSRPGSTRLSLHPLRSVAADGTQVYATALSVYFWGAAERKLVFKQWPPTPPNLARVPNANAPFSPTLPELESIVVTGGNRSERVLATDVEDFTLSRTGAVMQVRLRLRWDSPERPETFELNRRVYLPNRSR